MALHFGTSRPAYIGAAFAALAVVAGCTALGNQDLQVPQFYVKDYTLNVTARYLQGQTSATFETTRANYLKAARNVGLLYSPNYVFVADPTLLLTRTVPVALPSDQLVDETVIVDGKPQTQKVLRNPLFYIDRATVTYQVPGYDIPAATYELQIPVKANELTLPLPAIAQVGPLLQAYARDAAAAGTISGSMTVSLEMRNLDPIATQRTFKVSRSLPLVYSYTGARPEDELAQPSAQPTPPPPTPTPTPTPSASVEPSPTPSPTPSATAS
jgi:hypothetical protein